MKSNLGGKMRGGTALCARASQTGKKLEKIAKAKFVPIYKKSNFCAVTVYELM
jgi:hypothetical protein